MNDLKVDGILELRIVTKAVHLIETSNVPILAINIDGLINGWNMKIAELNSLSVDEVIGRHFLTLAKESSVEAMMKMFSLASQEKEQQNFEFHFKFFGLRIDDGPIILVVNARANQDIHDFVIGTYHSTYKLSGLKQLRDALALGSQLQKSSVKRDACFVGDRALRILKYYVVEHQLKQTMRKMQMMLQF
ncbi:phytochrome A-like [Dendrobium catenatum]|uniref:phytochrome A-like n=1 Tax=Dendrobium catenatum TaxID=906689 RepID=UPI0009F25CF9|nr:phytochrome A-like [Dendrobium catenatum]